MVGPGSDGDLIQDGDRLRGTGARFSHGGTASMPDPVCVILSATPLSGAREKTGLRAGLLHSVMELARWARACFGSETDIEWSLGGRRPLVDGHCAGRQDVLRATGNLARQRKGCQGRWRAGKRPPPSAEWRFQGLEAFHAGAARKGFWSSASSVGPM